ncbi:ribose transport system permease protein [Roseiarcus fermentans]|uniref:Ribose transport system permease protein n=1 Tax=Roseiarcus fermentans TaxID=1473586 RepID=A0A366F0G6_9HYPH|nr:SMP-30/gluconolactonase/LRE family protein [Roseiarcus fermentans]RBP08162.1 ribose transport system permease protein [Roseiarcus fermentans]
MSAQFEFAAAPKARTPYFVVSPRRVLSEILSKGWVESTVPFVAFLCVIFGVGLTSHGYFTIDNLRNLALYGSDGGLVVLALFVVVAAGGIDLSVGSNFAMSAFAALYCFHVLNLPVPIVLAASLASGAAVGVVNGALAGLAGCGALLTTLGTMITVRGVYTLASQGQLVAISSSARTDEVWDWIGSERVLGVPVNFWALILVAVAVLVMFRQSRFGWHVLAVGGNRKAARHGGIRVKATIFLAYTLGGVIVGLAGFLYAARENAVASDTGVGMEFFALTALVVGLGGFVPGRGSTVAVLIGFATIYILNNALLNAGLRGDFVQLAMGAILIVILSIDTKFRKHKHRLLASTYVDPVAFEVDAVAGAKGLLPGEIAAKLAGADILAAGLIDGPEDVILDADDHLFCGTRDGRLVRIAAPGYDEVETFAQIGGRPLGLALDREGRILVCVAGMGLVRVDRQRQVELLTDQTQRSLFTIQDDTTIRMADDLDVAPDGTIYFSDATKRYDIESWGLDLLEGRPNGRLLSWDPKTRKTRTVCDNLVFPNGVCLTHDGRHLLVASTWTCSLLIFDLADMRAGPRVFVHGLPGYPDNVNRASDGGYWIALAGMRNPVTDLAMRFPGVRRRMTRAVAPTHWLFGNLNIGGVLKIDAAGRVVDAYWDEPGGPLYMITSMREHKGALYLGGVTNNKIGRIRLAAADPSWTGPASYWGKAER